MDIWETYICLCICTCLRYIWHISAGYALLNLRTFTLFNYLNRSQSFSGSDHSSLSIYLSFFLSRYSFSVSLLCSPSISLALWIYLSFKLYLSLLFIYLYLLHLSFCNSVFLACFTLTVPTFLKPFKSKLLLSACWEYNCITALLICGQFIYNSAWAIPGLLFSCPGCSYFKGTMALALLLHFLLLLTDTDTRKEHERCRKREWGRSMWKGEGVDGSHNQVHIKEMRLCCT